MVKDPNQLVEVISNRFCGGRRFPVRRFVSRATKPVHLDSLRCITGNRAGAEYGTCLVRAGFCRRIDEQGCNDRNRPQYVAPRVEEDPPLGVLGKERRVFAPAQK